MLAVNTNALVTTGSVDGVVENLPLNAGQGEIQSGFVLDGLAPVEMPEGVWPAEFLPDQAVVADNALPMPETVSEPPPELNAQASDQQLLQAEELLGSLLQQQQMLLQAQLQPAPAAPSATVAVAQDSAELQKLASQVMSERQPGRNRAVTDAGFATPAAPVPTVEARTPAAPVLLTGDALTMELGVQAAEEQLSSVGMTPRPAADVGMQRPELPGLIGARPQAMEARLHLQGAESRWGEQMLNALRDNVELQLKQNKQQAVIRLDPAELGSVEIRLNQDSGRLQVQIHAAQSDVARLLQQTSERLRHDLATLSFSQVDVQVGSQSQSGQRHPSQADQSVIEQAPLANHSVEAAEHSGSRLRSDVLVSV